MPDYPDYVPGPGMPTVPLQLWHDQPVQQVSALYGLPQVNMHISSVAIPGTVGAFAPVVLGVTTGLLTPR